MNYQLSSVLNICFEGFKKEILQFWKPILTFLIPFAALPLPLLKGKFSREFDCKIRI